MEGMPLAVNSAIERGEDIMHEENGKIYVVDNVEKCVMIIEGVGVMTLIEF